MYVASGSATAGTMFASVHVLMDLDHIPDYIFWGSRPLGINRFFKDTYFPNWSRVVLLFRAFEWLAVMVVLLVLFPSWELAGVTLGYGAHMFMDQLGNTSAEGKRGASPLFYFISYRIQNGFRTPLLFIVSRKDQGKIRNRVAHRSRKCSSSSDRSQLP